MNDAQQARDLLNEELKRLQASWRQACKGWHDQRRDEFAVNFLYDIDARTNMTVQQLHELSRLIDAAEYEMGNEF